MKLKRVCSAAAAALLLSATASMSAWAQTVKAADEPRLKLAFLFNFVQFVDWPPASLAADASIRLCVVGEHSFGPDLDQLSGRPVRGRSLQVLRPTRIEDIRTCHLVYAERLSGTGVPPQMVAALSDAPVLLVSSEAGSASRGASIEFVPQGNRLRWHLNLETARQAGLRISAKLVELSLPIGDRS